MVQVDETLTRRIAELARLELTETETTLFTAQLRDVLGYMDLLQKADVANVEPMFHPIELSDNETVLRPDVVRPSPIDAEGKPKVLQSAPEVLNDGFKAPQIL